MRSNGRPNHALRKIRVTRNYIPNAEGSVLIEYGQTRVICTGTISDGIPVFLKGTQQGWLTAEYGMLPRATLTRTNREASRGKQGGRTLEIQRLIGRSLRAAVDLSKLSDYTITIDCDVIQADGGTRTASITGGCIALYDVIQVMLQKKLIKHNPFKHFIASISVGLVEGQPLLDLDYVEDSNAATDMNIVMDEAGHFIEVQGTAEKQHFTQQQLNHMLDLAQAGIKKLIEIQKEVTTNTTSMLENN